MSFIVEDDDDDRIDRESREREMDGLIGSEERSFC
jgi:hypothetical protein